MHDALANHVRFCLGVMEQTHPDDPVRMESSGLTPIDNIIATHTHGKTKKKKKTGERYSTAENMALISVELMLLNLL